MSSMKNFFLSTIKVEGGLPTKPHKDKKKNWKKTNRLENKKKNNRFLGDKNLLN